MNSFEYDTNPMGQILLLSPFSGKKTETKQVKGLTENPIISKW
jgi:hypothetical protein